ncbi:hypothetical protein MIPYR_50221 [uncultured Microbacterium sp.]|uniref:Uncharacterized protein n=1 Tax=uncultured Microbacterium sp. TaxID=191216 RepID=A0A1Y5P693_9MICO|nr:hypothetical protein MIPYR_50221 [uncultured Microbacterium sp.]
MGAPNDVHSSVHLVSEVDPFETTSRDARSLDRERDEPRLPAIVVDDSPFEGNTRVPGLIALAHEHHPDAQMSAIVEHHSPRRSLLDDANPFGSNQVGGDEGDRVGSLGQLNRVTVCQRLSELREADVNSSALGRPERHV